MTDHRIKTTDGFLHFNEVDMKDVFRSASQTPTYPSNCGSLINISMF